jgi:hypothetical protein
MMFSHVFHNIIDCPDSRPVVPLHGRCSARRTLQRKADPADSRRLHAASMGAGARRPSRSCCSVRGQCPPRPGMRRRRTTAPQRRARADQQGTEPAHRFPFDRVRQLAVLGVVSPGGGEPADRRRPAQPCDPPGTSPSGGPVSELDLAATAEQMILPPVQVRSPAEGETRPTSPYRGRVGPHQHRRGGQRPLTASRAGTCRSGIAISPAVRDP